MENRKSNIDSSQSEGLNAWEQGDAEELFDYFPVSLGTSLGTYEGKDVFQPSADRYCHTCVVGRTGSGKTNLVKRLEREDIRSGAGVAIIATHAEDALYPLSCVPKERMDDVVIIDATDPEYLPCLNPLGVDLYDRVAVRHAIESTLTLLKSGSQHDWAGPRFDGRMRPALELMMSAPPSACRPCIGMVQDVLTDPETVKGLLRYVTEKRLYDYWTKEYPAAMRSNDAGEVNDWALAKAAAFINDPALAAMFGPGKKTIDFNEIVDEGKILVVLAPASHIGEEASRIVRTWVMMQLFDAIMARGGSGSKLGLIRSGRSPEPLDPFYVFVDEFGEVASDDFARMLSQVRKRNVGMVLSFQNLDQLRVFNRFLGHRTSSVLDSVLANCGTVVAYQLGVDDARILADRFNVEAKELRDIERYRPKALVRLDGQECGPFDLDVPLASEPDDPAMPARIMGTLIDRGVLLPIKHTSAGYELAPDGNKKPGTVQSKPKKQKDTSSLKDYDDPMGGIVRALDEMIKKKGGDPGRR